MALASTSRTQLRYIEEVSFGVTPGSGTQFNLRMTGESLGFQLGSETSKEIRSDRQVSDLVLTSAQANGGYNLELSYNEHDDMIEAVAQGTWDTYGTAGVGSTFTADFAATTITNTGAALTGENAFTTLALGQWIRVNAPSHANHGRIVQISTTVAPTSTVITVSSLVALSTGTGITSCSVATSRLVNGTTQRSFTLEREHNDIDQFFPFRGQTASKLSLAFASGAIVSGSVDFLGKDSPGISVDTTLPGSATASLTYDSMNAVSGVGLITEGGALLTGTFIKSLNLSLDNKLRIQDAIGTLGAVGIGSGTIECTGTIEVYLADGTMYNKFVNNTSTSISFKSVDGAGNGYVFTFPKVKYSDAKVNAGAIDQDALISMPFTALLDPTTGKTFIVDRIGVAVTRL